MSYSSLYGASASVYTTWAMIIPAAGSLTLPAAVDTSAHVVTAPADVVYTGQVAASTTGGNITFICGIEAITDAAGAMDTANSADHAALKAADV
jgi:hypothetical protein